MFTPPSSTTPEAVREVRKASLQFKRVRSRGMRVDSVTAELRRELDENHFAERMRHAMGGGTS